MKRYKLLKDLPTFRAGDKFELRDDGCLYYLNTGTHSDNHWQPEVMAYHRKTLERFPNILEDWFEEIEEPKNPYFINWFGEISELSGRISDKEIKKLKEIGNYFETEEEAKLAVRKQTAWERLKDKGLEVTEWSHGLCIDKTIVGRFRYEFPIDNKEDIEKDLDLLFCPEENS